MRRVLVVVVLVMLAAIRPADAGCAPIAFDQPRLRLAASMDETIRITFLGHASFQIDTPQGVRAITDYNGVNGFGRHPDIVTMNNAHSTHFTDQPEDGIAYVLQGWPKDGEKEKVIGGRVPLHVVHDEAGTVYCYDTTGAVPVRRAMSSRSRSRVPARNFFDSGGRWYGSRASSPTRVMEPWCPRLCRVSTACAAACPAPTIATRSMIRWIAI